MRHIVPVTVLAAALSFVGLGRADAAEASSEVDRIPFYERYTLSHELKYPIVVADLAIKPEQSARIDALLEKTRAESKEEASRWEAGTPEEKKAQVATLSAEMKAAAAKDDIRFDKLSESEQQNYSFAQHIRERSQVFERRLEKILRPEQMRRLTEIVRRSFGPEIFAKDHRSTLELTVEQKLKFDVILERYRSESRKSREEYAEHVNDFNDQNEKIAFVLAFHRKSRAEERRVLQSMVELLTPRQKEVLDKLRGEEFDLDRFDEEADAAFRNL